jgi:hypothetical protein
MNKEIWNVGIIGLGGIGDYHMNHLSRIANTRVAASFRASFQDVPQANGDIL